MLLWQKLWSLIQTHAQNYCTCEGCRVQLEHISFYPRFTIISWKQLQLERPFARLFCFGHPMLSLGSRSSKIVSNNGIGLALKLECLLKSWKFNEDKICKQSCPFPRDFANVNVINICYHS